MFITRLYIIQRSNSVSMMIQLLVLLIFKITPLRRLLAHKNNLCTDRRV
jgi:hypothetical protein